MHQGRTRTIVLITLFAMVAALFHLTTTAHATPEIDSAQSEVNNLHEQAEAAAEQYNYTRVSLEQAQKRLASLRSDKASQQRIVEQMRGSVTHMVIDQYQGGALSTASQLVFAEDADAFVDNLNAVASYNNQRLQRLNSFAQELRRLKLRQAAVKAEEKELSKLTARLTAEKQELDARAASAAALLDSLTARQQAQIAAAPISRSSPTPREAVKNAKKASKDAEKTQSSNSPSSRASTAIEFAMAQVGGRYAYGGAGPNGYDCSGLTMAAFAKAGISLPHSSRAQMSSGRPVAKSDLQPGDLVFYYSPVRHVAIYIGNGQIVNALNPRSGIQVSPLDMMPYAGAVRVG